MSFAKSIVRLLPVLVQRAVHRRYYLGVVRSYQESAWEWTPFVKPLIPAGGTVIDIGANVGYLSGLFARWVGSGGRVISVEPIPDTYDALSSSMKKLFPETVTTIQSCVSDREGQVTMAVPEYEGGGSNFYESRIVDASYDAGIKCTVPCTTLDALIPFLNLTLTPNLNLLKIDVEGHELAVIRGGKKLFALHQPPLLIEVAGSPDEPGSAAAELFAELATWGYAPHLVKGGKLAPRVQGDRSVDYLFLKR